MHGNSRTHMLGPLEHCTGDNSIIPPAMSRSFAREARPPFENIHSSSFHDTIDITPGATDLGMAEKKIAFPQVNYSIVNTRPWHCRNPLGSMHIVCTLHAHCTLYGRVLRYTIDLSVFCGIDSFPNHGASWPGNDLLILSSEIGLLYFCMIFVVYVGNWLFHPTATLFFSKPVFWGGVKF